MRNVLYRFGLLFETSTEIEQRPLISRPRTMAAAWGGMLACKVASIFLISPEYGIPAFFAVLAAGAVATQARFLGRTAPEGGERLAALPGAV